MKKKVIKKQTYTIELTHFSDNTSTFKRTCDGFNALEIMGALEKIQLEILAQMAGSLKPTITKRIVKE